MQSLSVEGCKNSVMLIEKSYICFLNLEKVNFWTTKVMVSGTIAKDTLQVRFTHMGSAA